MFDIAPSELLLVAIVALVVIGPKDLPLALRSLGRWVGQMRRVSGHFRSGIETMIREAELAEIEKEWRERNARIMAEHPDGDVMTPFPADPAPALPASPDELASAPSDEMGAAPPPPPETR